MIGDATSQGSDEPGFWHGRRHRRRNRPVRVAVLTRGLLGGLLVAAGATVLLLAPEDGDRFSEAPSVLRLSGGGTLISGLAFSPDGQTLAVGHTGGELKLWDLATLSSRTIHPSGAMITSLVYTPDGRSVVFVDHGPAILRYDPATLEPRRPLVASGYHFTCLAVSHDGRTLAAGDDSGRVVLWNLAQQRIRAVLEGHRGMIGSLAFSSDDRMLASGGGRDGTIRLWDTGSGRPRKVLSGHLSVVAHTSMNQVISLSFSPDGRTLVSGGGFDPFVRRWSVATGRLLETWRLNRSGSAVSYVAFTQASTIPESLRNHPHATVRQWESSSGTVLAGHSGRSLRMTMTFHRRRLAMAQWGEVLIWPIEPDSSSGSDPGVRAGADPAERSATIAARAYDSKGSRTLPEAQPGASDS